MKPTLVILAAGMGSRYGGVKQIDAVGLHNETLLDFGVFDAKLNGFDRAVFIIRKDIEKDFRERLFDRIARNMDADYVFQEKTSLFSDDQIPKISNRIKPWGTVHAILCSEKAVKTPFAVVNADDYYGREAYRVLGKYLATLNNEDRTHAMVGYKLLNTMSKMGSVSRGVCKVKDGLLESMRENTKIEFQGDKIVSHLPEGDVYLTGEEWVSMNFFGFTPKAYEYFHEYWDNFLRTNIEEPKVECLLPNCASEIVSSNNGTINVFTTPEKWFGMTYKEDKENVRKNLAQKIDEGYYPERLWGK